MNIEGLKKRKELIENNLKQLNQKIIQDTQNALRLEGAILNINELINNEENTKKELENKKEVKTEKKKG